MFDGINNVYLLSHGMSLYHCRFYQILCTVIPLEAIMYKKEHDSNLIGHQLLVKTFLQSLE